MNLMLEGLALRLRLTVEDGASYETMVLDVLRNIRDQAQAGDEWTSGHDLEVRIGAIVCEVLRDSP